ncbi:unnamed protein product [Rotaria sp. Silwood1]|nr:unnamed protein product [Rotaria sp. Silwood1]
MRELIKKQQQEAERDRTLHQQRIEEMAMQYKREQDAANQRYEQLMRQMNEQHQQQQREREDADRRYAGLQEEINKFKTQVTLECGGKGCPRCGLSSFKIFLI